MSAAVKGAASEMLKLNQNRRIKNSKKIIKKGQNETLEIEEEERDKGKRKELISEIEEARGGRATVGVAIRVITGRPTQLYIQVKNINLDPIRT